MSPGLNNLPYEADSAQSLTAAGDKLEELSVDDLSELFNGQIANRSLTADP